MSGHEPHFDEIVAADDPERERLQGVHELLLAAGPPAELPPELAQAPPEPSARTLTFPRRRYTAIAAVAIAATIIFGIGFAIGDRNAPPSPIETLTLSGSGNASASLDLLPKDEAGNWPMTLAVTGLPALPDGKTYTLWLTKDGELAASCGEFVVAESGTTTVPLNAPFRLRQFDAWVVVRTGTTEPVVLHTGKA